MQKPNVIDATQVCASKVVLKCLPAASEEVRIALFLTSPEMRADPRNRTVPIIDIIPIPGDKHVLLVMPYLRVFDTPPFHCIGEIIDAFRQFLQVYAPFYSSKHWNSPHFIGP
jgi:hypothetical protein